MVSLLVVVVVVVVRPGLMELCKEIAHCLGTTFYFAEPGVNPL